NRGRGSSNFCKRVFKRSDIRVSLIKADNPASSFPCLMRCHIKSHDRSNSSINFLCGHTRFLGNHITSTSTFRNSIREMRGHNLITVMRDVFGHDRLIHPINRWTHARGVSSVPLNDFSFAMFSSPIFNLSAITPRVTRQKWDIVLLEGVMHRVSNLTTRHTPARVTRSLPQPLHPNMRI